MANECLSLIITAQCNLRCRYCYQNAKTARRAEWDVMQAGIDLAFGKESSHVTLLFLGGEPLLELDLLRRAVSYAEALDNGRKHFHFAVSTNGTLISDEVADYLDEHQFDVRLSFDGVEQSQACRGIGTFETLNGVLVSLRARHPQLFNARLRISMTVVPATIPSMADSVRYMLEKDVRDVVIGPCLTPCPEWHRDGISELDAAFGQIAEICRDHAEKAGTIPLKLFKKATDDVTQDRVIPSACDALTGNALTLDLDGQLYTCPLLAESYQQFPPGSLLEQVSRLKLGDVRDPEVRNRRAAFSQRAQMANLWTHQKGGCSSYGNCFECEYFGRCIVCPVSVWQISGSSGPFRVPDFVCAFNKVALKYRDHFPTITEALKKFLPEPAPSDPIRQLEEYLRNR